MDRDESMTLTIFRNSSSLKSDSRSSQDFISITILLMSSGDYAWPSDRCSHTGSRSQNATRRRPRRYGLFSMNETALKFGSHLSDKAALLKIVLIPRAAWEKDWKNNPKYYLTDLSLVRLLQLPGVLYQQ